jgi:hypothetical protein
MAKSVSRVLSADEVCKILEACSLAGVLEFNYSGLSLKFHSLGPANVIVPSQAVSPSEANVPVIPFEDPEAKLMNEQTIDDAEEAQMMIEDSFAYERHQIMKDIERNRVHDG